MRTIRTKVYQFSELSEQAKQKAIEWYRGGDNSEFAWSGTKEDASQIGLKIASLDDHRPNKGELIYGANWTANKILTDHGEHCETYKTAQKFIDEVKTVNATTPVIFEEGTENEYEDYYDRNFQIDELEIAFLESLLEDYRIMYNQNIDYQNSDKAIIEAIEANEYEFKADGSRF